MSSTAVHWNEPTTLIRVLRECVQRVPADLSSLTSYAAFILISDRQQRIMVWVGRRCSNVDNDYAEHLAKEINYQEFNGTEDYCPAIVYEAGLSFDSTRC